MASISFSGLASGIDSDSIIKSILDSKRLAYAPIKAKATANDSEVTALQAFNTKLLALNDTVTDFMTLSGSAISKTASSSNEDAVSASVSGGSTVTSTTVNVQSLAKCATFSFADRFSSTSSAIAPGLSGSANITLQVGTGDSAQSFQIPVDSSTTLQGLADSINSTAIGSAHASTVNLGTDSNPQYALVITGNSTGTSAGSLSVTADSAITAQGVFQSSTLDQAQDAVLTVSGIGEIRRSTNQISGVVPGVTLNLKQAGAGPVLISVSNNAQSTADKFSKLVDALNDVITYSKQNSTITQQTDSSGNTTNVYGTLAHTRVDDQALSAIRSAIGESNAGSSGTSVKILADLGLTTQKDGTYKFDEKTFLAGVANDPTGASSLINSFADKLGATNGVIDQYTRYQGTIATAIDSDKEETKSINDRIDQIEASLSDQEKNLKLLYAQLEANVSKMNSASTSLTQMLSSLSSSS